MLLGEPVARKGEKLAEALRKVLRLESVSRAAQGGGGHGVGARGAPDAEVDAPRVQGLQNPEGLGDLQRGVVGEHDPAGAHPDPLRHARELSDQDLGRGAGDAREVVVLGQPVALVAELVGEPGKLEGVAKRMGAV